ncbi:MAG: fumarylacetoacetate hydrolase family protein [Hyphomicrobiaceae bacterium]
MSTSPHDRASDLLWQCWQRGDVTADLPAELKPTTRREGYAIQAGLDRHSTKPRVGWKIAATSSAGQKHIGVDGPLAGRILAERVIDGRTPVSIKTNRMRVAEPEFAFRIGRELMPRDKPYAVDEVMAAIEALHLTIELPDSRFTEYAKVGGPALIADNACAHELIIGPAVTADWRVIDLSQHKVKAHMRAKGDRDGIGSNVYGDPRVAMTWIANELSGIGISLRPGEIITTGTCMVPLEIVEGDHINADFGVLGTISCSIARQEFSSIR